MTLDEVIIKEVKICKRAYDDLISDKGPNEVSGYLAGNLYQIGSSPNHRLVLEDCLTVPNISDRAQFSGLDAEVQSTVNQLVHPKRPYVIWHRHPASFGTKLSREDIKNYLNEIRIKHPKGDVILCTVVPENEEARFWRFEGRKPVSILYQVVDWERDGVITKEGK